MPAVSVKFQSTYSGQKTKQKLFDAAVEGLNLVTFAFEAEAKKITTVDRHVVTGRYRGSINASQATPTNYVRGSFDPVADGVHQKLSFGWRTGTNVEYAPELEKRYGIFVRAVDSVRNDIADIVASEMLKRL